MAETTNDPLAVTPMDEVSELAADYAHAHRHLAELIQNLEERIEAVKSEAMPEIRAAARAVIETRGDLHYGIELYPELWQKRRTVVIENIRVGLTKGAGRLAWDSDEQVVKLIRKHFHDQADVLIQTTEKPVRKALGQLTAAELKKIGVSIEGADDQVVIKATDSDIDKLVDKMVQASETQEDGS